MGDPPDGVTVRHLTSDDVGAAAAVFAASLGNPVAPDGIDAAAERYDHYWDVEHCLGAFDREGRVLGVAATWAARMTVEGGAALPCAAVPSVGVRPDSHGRGIGRALLERQLHWAAGRGAALLALNASETGIYGRYGYGPTSLWWSIEADPRGLEWRDDAPRATVGSIREVDDVAAAVPQLADLHRRALGRWSGELSRTDGWWWRVANPRDGDAPAQVAVHHDADGTVDGFVSWTIERCFDDTGFANRVEIEDCVALSVEVEAMLWRWLLERRLVGRVRAERADPRLPLEWMLVESRRLLTRYRTDAAWVRVVDLPRVLAARTTSAVGSVLLRVVDPLVAVNDRTWLVTGDGRALTVEEAEGRAPVSVPIDLLAPLVWGHATVATLAAAGRVDVADTAAVAELDRLLAVAAPAWCSTGF